MVTSDEFVSWKASPNTKFFLTYLNDYREFLKNELASGKLSSDKMEATAMKHAECIGTCNALLDILDLEYADISLFYKLETEEENDNRINTP